MPRQINPEIHARIVAAARKLWHKGGEDALSMRAIARAAHTNTPAVYRRFRDRQEILHALVATYLDQLFKEVEPATSVSDLLNRVLEFAMRQPREYQLMTSGLLARVTKLRPAVELAAAKTASWLGGTPDENRKLVLCVWSMMHGLILLRISGTMREEEYPLAVASFHRAVEILVEKRDKIDGIRKTD